LNAEQQVLSDTKPLLQKILGVIISPIWKSSKTNQKVRVKVDLLSNPKTKKAAIVFRIKDL
jgi:hypothetical protein